MPPSEATTTRRDDALMLLAATGAVGAVWWLNDTARQLVLLYGSLGASVPRLGAETYFHVETLLLLVPVALVLHEILRRLGWSRPPRARVVALDCLLPLDGGPRFDNSCRVVTLSPERAD